MCCLTKRWLLARHTFARGGGGIAFDTFETVVAFSPYLQLVLASLRPLNHALQVAPIAPKAAKAYLPIKL